MHIHQNRLLLTRGILSSYNLGNRYYTNLLERRIQMILTKKKSLALPEGITTVSKE